MKTRLEKNEKLSREIKLREKKEKKERKRKKVRKMFVFFIFLICLGLIYARYIEPSMLFVNEHKIVSNEISDSFHGLKIVHFSDLHYGSTIDKDNVNKVVDKINILKPDVVVFSGDLIEEGYEMSKKDIEILTKALNDITSSLGKYAVMGNHDYYNEDVSKVYEKTDFNVLTNNYDIIYNKDNNPILIYGVDDVLFGSPDVSLLNDDKIKDIDYRIVVVHEGDYANEILDYGVDLVLAGHSHNGQVNLPFAIEWYLPDGCKEYYRPYYKVNETEIFVSNGVGTSLLKLRFASFPSINLYRLNKSK